MRLTKTLAASMTATLALTLGASGIATADGGGAPANTGWDGLPNPIMGGGSDTTYPIITALGDIYNRAPGCTVDTGANSATKAECLATQPTDVSLNGNYDHDVVSQAYPAGSTAGIISLVPAACQTGPNQYNPAINFARSSRAPKACPSNSAVSETDKDGGGLTFWGFATDGLVGLTYAGRQISTITLQQMHDIYTCAITKWNVITGNPADATATIIPFGMNKASGTYSTFNKLIGTATGDATFDVDGAAGAACVHQVTFSGGGTGYPFENDAKPILDPAQNGGVTTSNIFWFGSFGEWASFPFKRQSGKITPIGNGSGVTGCTSPCVPNVNDLGATAPVYPLTRTIFHVTKKTDADWNATAQAVQPNTGTAHVGGDIFASASSGAGGAVRQFTNFLCTVGAQANDSYYGLPTNPTSGYDIGVESADTINKFNFGLVGNPTANSSCAIIR